MANPAPPPRPRPTLARTMVYSLAAVAIIFLLIIALAIVRSTDNAPEPFAPDTEPSAVEPVPDTEGEELPRELDPDPALDLTPETPPEGNP